MHKASSLPLRIPYNPAAPFLRRPRSPEIEPLYALRSRFPGKRAVGVIMGYLTAVEWIILLCGALATGFMFWVFCMFTEQLTLSRKLAKRSESETAELRIEPMNPRTEPLRPGLWW
jgi:hypothetical protein